MNGPTFARVLVFLSLGTAVAAVSAHEPSASRIFIGRETAIEDCLRTAKVVKYRDLGVGITRPARVHLKPLAHAWDDQVVRMHRIRAILARRDRMARRIAEIAR